jgi:hypothetical protein
MLVILNVNQLREVIDHLLERHLKAIQLTLNQPLIQVKEELPNNYRLA